MCFSNVKLGDLIRSPSGIVVSETLALAVLQFGTFSVLVRVTDMETVGLWVLINSLLGFSRAADFWSRGLSSFIGEARGKGKASEAIHFVSTAVISGVVGYGLLAVLGAVMVYTFAGMLVGDSHVADARAIVPFIGLVFWILSTASIYHAGFLAFGRPGLKATQTVGGAAVFLALALWLAPTLGLWGILVAQALQAAAMLAYATLTFHCVLSRGKGMLWRADLFSRLISFGSKSIFVGMLQLAIEPVVRMLASGFGGLSAVTAVDLASRLIAVARGVITALGQVLVPEFARLGASSSGALTILYRDTSRLFLITSLSTFGLLVSAAPGVEDLILGRTGTGFELFLCILCVGWFANTVSSPAYFLLLGQRRLRPLFWANAIMSGGAVVVGYGGGGAGHVAGALGGVSIALVGASFYLVHVASAHNANSIGFIGLLRREPKRLLPLVCAGLAAAAVQSFNIPDGDLAARGIVYSLPVLATIVCAVLFGDVREVIRVTSSIR